MAQAVALPRQCDEVGCSEVMTPESDQDAWQVLPEVGLVLCDEHRVCDACYGEGYCGAYGDKEIPCTECFDPYPEF